MTTLQDILFKYLQTDTDYNSLDEKRIIDTYLSSNRGIQYVIDDIFISICGYSLETLINEYNKEREL